MNYVVCFVEFNLKKSKNIILITFSIDRIERNTTIMVKVTRMSNGKVFSELEKVNFQYYLNNFN